MSLVNEHLMRLYMETSFYLIQYPWNEEQVLLFSARQGSLAIVDKNVYNQLINGDLSGEENQTFIDLGMIVENRRQEMNDIINFFDLFQTQNLVCQFTIAMNLDCNFSCSYCYEGLNKSKRYMSIETLELVFNFIISKLEQGMKTIVVDFHGGEPLLSLNQIEYLAKKLSITAKQYDAEFHFSLVTNGSLMTRNTIERLSGFGLVGAKVTIDGPKSNHNMHRPFCDGSGSFDVIIENIKDSRDLIKVGIGGNFSKNNYREFVKLLDYLIENDLTPKNIFQIKFDPIMLPNNYKKLPIAQYDGCISINDSWVNKAIIFLREEILQRGYSTQRPKFVKCAANVKNSFIIDCDGFLYKCPMFVGNSSFAIGNLKSNHKHTENFQNQIWKNKRCENCIYLPLCFGGCRYSALTASGNVNETDCRKTFFDTSLETILKQDIKYTLT